MVQLNIEQHFIVLAVLVAGVQGFLLSPIIIWQRSKHVSFTYLAIFFLLISLGCLEMGIEGLFYPPKGKELPFPMTFKLAYLPAIYLHLSYLMDRDRVFNFIDLVHFVPALVLDFLSALLISYEGNVSGMDIIADPRHISWFVRFYDIFFIVHMLVYLLTLARLKNTYLPSVEHHWPQVARWFENVFWMVMLIWFGWTAYKITSAGMPLKGSLPYYFLHGTIIACIYWLGYCFIFREKAQLNGYLKSEKQNTTCYLSLDDILKSMRELELHRREKLTIHQAAAMLGVNAAVISTIINRETHKNFNEFINYLRIEDFKRLVVKPEYQKYSLFGIAQEVGFSSKTSFFRAFKKEEGLTPKEHVNKTSELTSQKVSDH